MTKPLQLARIPHNAVIANGTVTITLKMVLERDRGDMAKERWQTFHLSFDAIGSAGLLALPEEMQKLGGQVLNKIYQMELQHAPPTKG